LKSLPYILLLFVSFFEPIGFQYEHIRIAENIPYFVFITIIRNLQLQWGVLAELSNGFNSERYTARCGIGDLKVFHGARKLRTNLLPFPKDGFPFAPEHVGDLALLLKVNFMIGDELEKTLYFISISAFF